MSPENWNCDFICKWEVYVGRKPKTEQESPSNGSIFNDPTPVAESPDTERPVIHIICVDCGSDFIFSPGEQVFFQQKGLSPPKRCPLCRAWRRVAKKINSRVGG